MASGRLAEDIDLSVARTEGRPVSLHPVERELHILRDLPPARTITLDVAITGACQAVKRSEDNKAALGELGDSRLKAKE